MRLNFDLSNCTNFFELTLFETSISTIFINSRKIDFICSYFKDVEKFAIRRAERGVRVQLVLFMNSPHVKHYATYPNVYVDTVYKFIHKCLTSLSFESMKLSQDDSEENNPRKYDTCPDLTKRVVLG